MPADHALVRRTAAVYSAITGRLPNTSISNGIVVIAPKPISARPTALRCLLVTRPASNSPIPAPKATRVLAIKPSSGRVMVRACIMSNCSMSPAKGRMVRRLHCLAIVINLVLVISLRHKSPELWLFRRFFRCHAWHSDPIGQLRTLSISRLLWLCRR
jgi:hypothetical protein